MQVGTATVMGQTRNDVGILVWNCLQYVHLEDREWDAVPRHIGCLVERRMKPAVILSDEYRKRLAFAPTLFISLS